MQLVVTFTRILRMVTTMKVELCISISKFNYSVLMPTRISTNSFLQKGL